eukprot:TRINITY_DN120752_c0_g1_i1.p1 TRINITY_DN120752_c0_g1~~TRINITY_DN120752_c0_g1_i1.p1  ORF type:complete len:880 (-),score=189.04 TRINITY_DN120752_c0_g1_i1:94-2733(-)
MSLVLSGHPRPAVSASEPRFIQMPAQHPVAPVSVSTVHTPRIHAPTRVQSVPGHTAGRSSSPTTRCVTPSVTRQMVLGCASPVRWHVLDATASTTTTTITGAPGDHEKKLLQHALAESQATLREEARRAGAAEALLRERTASLVEHQRASRDSFGSKQGPLKLRSNSSSSVSVGSDMHMELQCAMSVRDRLAEKLAHLERENAGLRQSESEHRARAEAAVGESEGLRVKLDASECEKSKIQDELRSLTAEHRRSTEELSSRLSTLQHELAGSKAQLEALQSELSVTRDLLEQKTSEARRLARERADFEDLQVLLAQSREELASREEDLATLIEEKRDAEVSLRAFQQCHGLGDQQQLHLIADLQVQVDRLSRQVASAESQLGEQQGSSVELATANQLLRQQLVVAEQQRLVLHNAVQELKGNIRVICRVRPSHEADIPLAVQPPQKGVCNRVCLNHCNETYSLNFDKVFGPSASQADVYEEVNSLVQSALDGFKVCIFAYGQTGSGKTYTMEGARDPGCCGLIPRSLITIFKSVEDMKPRGWSWVVRASLLEVYNENIRDLLRDRSGDSQQPQRFDCVSGGSAASSEPHHLITQHEAWGTVVTGMTCVAVHSVDEVTALMAQAAKHRAVAATSMNQQSSRSHLVLALYLQGVNTILETEVFGALHLVDLGGSERLDKSHSTGERLKETQAINRSLSSLADVFSAKAEGSSHVPFRNSKLTHLMEPCLSGQGKTLMLVNISPELSNSHETLCSLRFAKQVSQCNTGGKPQRHVKTLRTSSPPPSQCNPASGRKASPSPSPPRASERTASASAAARTHSKSPLSCRQSMRPPTPRTGSCASLATTTARRQSSMASPDALNSRTMSHEQLGVENAPHVINLW